MLEEFPNVLTNYNFGYSYENRTLRAVKLSHKAVSKSKGWLKYKNSVMKQKKIWISGKSNHFHWIYHP